MPRKSVNQMRQLRKCEVDVLHQCYGKKQNTEENFLHGCLVILKWMKKCFYAPTQLIMLQTVKDTIVCYPSRKKLNKSLLAGHCELFLGQITYKERMWRIGLLLSVHRTVSHKKIGPQSINKAFSTNRLSFDTRESSGVRLMHLEVRR